MTNPQTLAFTLDQRRRELKAVEKRIADLQQQRARVLLEIEDGETALRRRETVKLEEIVK